MCVAATNWQVSLHPERSGRVRVAPVPPSNYRKEPSMAFSVRKPVKGSGKYPVWAKGITQDMDVWQREIEWNLKLFERGQRLARLRANQ